MYAQKIRTITTILKRYFPKTKPENVEKAAHAAVHGLSVSMVRHRAKGTRKLAQQAVHFASLQREREMEGWLEYLEVCKAAGIEPHIDLSDTRELVLN